MDWGSADVDGSGLRHSGAVHGCHGTVHPAGPGGAGRCAPLTSSAARVLVAACLRLPSSPLPFLLFFALLDASLKSSRPAFRVLSLHHPTPPPPFNHLPPPFGTSRLDAGGLAATSLRDGGRRIYEMCFIVTTAGQGKTLRELGVLRVPGAACRLDARCSMIDLRNVQCATLKHRQHCFAIYEFARSLAPSDQS
eukprot:91176-Rhodomonas_salina.1